MDDDTDTKQHTDIAMEKSVDPDDQIMVDQLIVIASADDFPADHWLENTDDVPIPIPPPTPAADPLFLPLAPTILKHVLALTTQVTTMQMANKNALARVNAMKQEFDARISSMHAKLSSMQLDVGATMTLYVDSISNGPDGNNTRIEGLSEDDVNEESDPNDNGEDDEPVQSQPTKMLTPPPTTSRKRKCRTKISPPDHEPLAKVKEVTFITSMISAAEMKKPASKHTLRNQTFSLNLNEPWNTMKAQILIKISDALNPRLLSYEDYEVSWFIPHVLPKPGLSLLNEKDFDIWVK
ncbi:hypothetical protein C8R48DRAFT_772572 [Suillus tomentosus]|nr:hypothetical protein C8R48DRAFT_772572 [Suillus tomentosus]